MDNPRRYNEEACRHCRQSRLLVQYLEADVAVAVVVAVAAVVVAAAVVGVVEFAVEVVVVVSASVVVVVAVAAAATAEHDELEEQFCEKWSTAPQEDCFQLDEVP